MFRLLALVALLAVAACTKASPIMETADGSYFVSTIAAPAAGGTTGAYTRAQEEAVKFCATKGGRPVLVGANDRDVYMSTSASSYGGNIWGNVGGGSMSSTDAAGTANVRFRCQ